MVKDKEELSNRGILSRGSRLYKGLGRPGPVCLQGIHRPKAQSILEYGLITACIAAALLGMQIYVKRAMEGSLKQAGDEIGEQYTPTNVASQITIKFDSHVSTNVTLVDLKDADGNLLSDASSGLPLYGIETKTGMTEFTDRDGYEHLGKFENKLF